MQLKRRTASTPSRSKTRRLKKKHGQRCCRILQSIPLHDSPHVRPSRSNPTYICTFLFLAPIMKSRMNPLGRYGRSSTCAPLAGGCAPSSSTSCARPWLNPWASSQTKNPAKSFSLPSTPTRWGGITGAAFPCRCCQERATNPQLGERVSKAPSGVRRQVLFFASVRIGDRQTVVTLPADANFDAVSSAHRKFFIFVYRVGQGVEQALTVSYERHTETHQRFSVGGMLQPQI